MYELRNIPKFTELPTIPDTGEHHAWGVFGEADERGTLNFLNSSHTRTALQSVSDGHVISLSLPLDSPIASLSTGRSPYKHEVLKSRMGRDDYLDGFFPQGSSQWDALSHIRYREFGYYGGREEADIDRGELGIDTFAKSGIIGRAVVLDAEPILQGGPDQRQPLSIGDLERILAEEEVEVADGDILLLRTGWLKWYKDLSDAKRAELEGSLHNGEGGLECPGLEPSEEMAAWLWDHRVAAVAADNPTVETLRVRRSEGFLHRRLIPLLGMPLGELWDLEALINECKRSSRYTCAVISAPCYIPGGAGSPCNAYAVF